jgi:hypothetical protein
MQQLIEWHGVRAQLAAELARPDLLALERKFGTNLLAALDAAGAPYDRDAGLLEPAPPPLTPVQQKAWDAWLKIGRQLDEAYVRALGIWLGGLSEPEIDALVSAAKDPRVTDGRAAFALELRHAVLDWRNGVNAPLPPPPPGGGPRFFPPEHAITAALVAALEPARVFVGYLRSKRGA